MQNQLRIKVAHLVEVRDYLTRMIEIPLGVGKVNVPPSEEAREAVRNLLAAREVKKTQREVRQAYPSE